MCIYSIYALDITNNTFFTLRKTFKRFFCLVFPLDKESGYAICAYIEKQWAAQSRRFDACQWKHFQLLTLNAVGVQLLLHSSLMLQLLIFAKRSGANYVGEAVYIKTN